MRNILIVSLIIVLSGCATAGWRKILPETYKDKQLKFSATLPMGWMRFEANKVFMLTKDGAALNYIDVNRIKFDEPLKNTKKRFKAGMLPYELAEVQIDNYKGQVNIQNLEIISNEALEVSGKKAFKVVTRFQLGSGLWKRNIQYGFIHDGFYYRIAYEAAEQYYYAKTEKDFEVFMKSFSLEN